MTFFEATNHENSSNPIRNNIPTNKCEYCYFAEQLDFDKTTIILKAKECSKSTQLFIIELNISESFIRPTSCYFSNTIIHPPLYKVLRT